MMWRILMVHKAGKLYLLWSCFLRSIFFLIIKAWENFSMKYEVKTFIIEIKYTQVLQMQRKIETNICWKIFDIYIEFDYYEKFPDISPEYRLCSRKQNSSTSSTFTIFSYSGTLLSLYFETKFRASKLHEYHRIMV